jgi:hypothetical protein
MTGLPFDMVPDDPRKPPVRGRPWKTVAGALLWAVGVLLEVLPLSHARTIGLVFQGLGMALGVLGALTATADFVYNAPFLRFATTFTGQKAWPMWAFLIGGMLCAGTRFAIIIAPSNAGGFRVLGAATAVLCVVGWREWLADTVARSR